MRFKYVATFVSGLVLGGGIGYMIRWKLVEKKQEKEPIDDISEEYRRGSDVKKKKDIEDYDTYPSSAEGEKEALREAREQMKKMKSEPINYKSYYDMKKEEEDRLAEGEHPEEDENDGVDEEMLAESMSIQEEHLSRRNEPPEYVDENDLGDVPSYVEEDPLYYDVENDILSDDDDELVDDRWSLFGNMLDDYVKDMKEGKVEDKGMVYIWNHSQDVLYSIEFI